MKHLRERDEDADYTKVHKEAERIDRRDRIILKNEEERSVFEEVFDRRTLMKLYDLANRKAFSYLNGVVSSGKEARVYWGVREDKSSVAVKIYLVASSDFKKRAQYVVGDPRFTRFSRDSRGIAELWARKEFTNLEQAYIAGVRVPRPETFLGNVLVMQFIGEEGVHAPQLVDSEVTKKDYLEIVRQTKILYRDAGLVHADLSEFNIFKHHEEVILFDFGSAVSTAHPMAQEFLSRDVLNLNRFFSKRGITTLPDEKVVNSIRGHIAKREEELPSGVF